MEKVQEAATGLSNVENETVPEAVPRENADGDEGGKSPPLAEQPEATPTVDQNTPLDFTPSKEPDVMKVVQAGIEYFKQEVKAIEESSSKTTGELRDMHRLFHNEFANRLKSMQDELDGYRERDKGRVFDGILGDVAKLYDNYESILDEIEDPRIKKRIGYMFLDITQNILEPNGASRQKSNPGDKRNTKYCQVVERIPTDRPELHDTVVQSRSTGFYIGNRPLVKELVDIYLFTEKNADKPAETQGET